MCTLLRYTLAALVLFAATGCGRFGPPKPPELFGAKKVSDLEAKAAPDRLTLSWRSPDRDIRDKELKSLEGYRILRANEKDFRKREKLADYLEEIGYIEDSAVEEREEAREIARETPGTISRRIKIPEERRHFSFDDTSVQQGETYLYRIVAMNQGGVKGDPSDIVKVFFKGEASEVFMVKDENALDKAEMLSEFEEEARGEESASGVGLFNVRP